MAATTTDSMSFADRLALGRSQRSDGCRVTSSAPLSVIPHRQADLRVDVEMAAAEPQMGFLEPLDRDDGTLESDRFDTGHAADHLVTARA